MVKKFLIMDIIIIMKITIIMMKITRRLLKVSENTSYLLKTVQWERPKESGSKYKGF